MPALSTLLPTGDSAVGSFTTDSGGTTNLWQKIEETIASAVDTNDYIKGPNDTNNTDYKFLFTATPSGFNSIKTLNWQVRYALSGAPPASNKDTYGLAIRIVNGATILAAADSGGTFQTIVSTTTMSTSFTNSASTAFTYVNTSASKATWDAAVCELRMTYTQTASKDAHTVYVSAIEFTGTYNAVITASAGSFTQTGAAVTFTKGARLTASVGSLTLTGVDATLRKTIPLAVSVGSFTETGVNPNLYYGRNLTAELGTFALSGVAAGLSKTYRMPADLGSLTFDGENNNLLYSRLVSAALGTFALTGQDTGLRADRKLASDIGLFGLTGPSANLLSGHVVSTSTGAFVLTGEDAALSYQQAGNYTLTASAGSFIESGAAATLQWAHYLSASPASYSEAGADANLLSDRKLIAASASYSLTGYDATLTAAGSGAYLLTAATGAFAFTGGDILTAWVDPDLAREIASGFNEVRSIAPPAGSPIIDSGLAAGPRSIRGSINVSRSLRSS